MISKDAFMALCHKSEVLAATNIKLQEIIRDQLTPTDSVVDFYAVQVSGAPGLLCLTQDNVYSFWTQKLFFFFKFPVVQTFHLAHIRDLNSTGSSLSLRAQADPVGAPEDYEENTFVFKSTAEAEKFSHYLRSVTTLN